MKAAVVLALFALIAATSAVGIGLGYGLLGGYGIGNIGRGFGGLSYTQRIQGYHPIGIGYGIGLGHHGIGLGGGIIG